MSAKIQHRNVLLNQLSAADRGAVLPHLRPVDLPVRKHLAPVNKAIADVYFLEAGMASVTSDGRRQTPVEIGMIGREGIVNLPAVLGAEQSPNETYMQMSGSGHSMDVATLRDLMAQSLTLSQLLLRYAHLFMMQMSSTVLANGRGAISERLARWILMAADRHDGDALPLTHEFLAMMLGVRRPGVTTSLRKLEAMGLIRGARGVVHVLDRAGLEKKANGYYGAAEAEYARLFGPIEP